MEKSQGCYGWWVRGSMELVQYTVHSAAHSGAQWWETGGPFESHLDVARSSLAGPHWPVWCMEEPR